MSALGDTQQLQSSRILLLGESCVDQFVLGSADRMSPEAPVPVFCPDGEPKCVPGMALNVEANLRGFGIHPEILTNPEPITKTRYIDRNTKQQLLRVDTGENYGVRPLMPDDVLHEDFDYVLFSDYDKGLITHEFAEHVCRSRNGRGVFVDSKKPDLSCYHGATIKINKKENELKTHVPKDCHLIVTLGADGVLYRGNHIPGRPVGDLIDPCGAGDTFFASLVAEYIQSGDLTRSISFANICASRAVSQTGTYAITQEDIDDAYLLL